MRKKTRWTPRALSDLDAIFDYLAQESAASIEKQFRFIEAAVDGLYDFPGKGRPGQVEGTRELVVYGTPYVVAYVEREHCVEVLAVIHGARRWPKRFDLKREKR